MAEGWMRHHHGNRVRVSSAGVERSYVRPHAIAVMKEVGIDISAHASKHVDDLDEPFDYVITVCDHAREVCPYVPARVKNLHHSFPDPSAATGTEADQQAVFRAVRDAIGAWIDERLIPQLQE